MKKNYFMLVCLMLFMAINATAQVSSVADLFGKYRFTADVEFSEAGNSYKSVLSGDCDATIEEDGTYIAKIVGFAGSQTQQNINAISTEQNMLKVLNLNNPALWSNGLMLANENGDNPYGVWDSEAGEWAVESYGPVYYTFDPATKEISIPDFTVITLSSYAAAKGTVIAKYTNVKMTLVEATTVEIADVSGDWNFKAGSSTYSTMAGSTIPTEFAVALAKTDDSNKTYNATFSIEGFDAVTLPATFDGNILSVAYDSTYLDAVNGIRFGNMNGSKVKKGSVEFKSQTEDAFTLYSGFSFVVDSIGKNKAGDADSTIVKLQQWYMDGTLKKPTEAPAFDWAGVYNVKTADPYVADAAGIDWPTEFQFEVAYNEGNKCYLVTKVFGYDITSINYDGGLVFTPAEDGKMVEIKAGNLASLGGGMFMKILDMNLSANPIVMTVNEDGTMSIAGLTIATGEYGKDAYGENAMNVWYSNLAITKEVVEDDEEDEETPAFSWMGQHTVKAGKVDSYDGNEWPAEFTMTVSDVNGSILVTEFLGNDVSAINYGGILFTIAEDGMSAEMKAGSYVGGGMPEYLKLYDMNASTSPIQFTLNEDGSVNVANFFIKHVKFDENYNSSESAAVYYQNVTIPAVGGDVEEPEEAEPFDWYGTWEVAAANIDVYDGKEYPSSFYMTIEELSGAPFITQFMSNDVKGINYGGILLTVADDNKTAEMQTGKFAGGKYPDYLKIYDMNAQESPVVFTANEDGSISIANFYLKNYNWDTTATSAAAFYKNVTATKCPTGIEDVVVENSVVEGIFDIQGRKVSEIAAPGLYIINGKKVLVK